MEPQTEVRDLPRIRHARTTLLLVLVGAWMAVPRTIQTLTAPKHRNEVGVDPPYTRLAAVSQELLAVTVLACCALVAIEALRDRPRRGVGAVVLLILPWLYLEIRDWTLHAHLSWSGLIYPGVVVALWALRPALRQLEVIGYLVGIVAVVSIGIGFLLPTQGIFRHADGSLVTQTKALVPGGILVGIFTHGNNLGQFLVVGIPMVALIRRRALRNLLLVASTYALVWSAARSSLITLGAVVAVVLVLALLPGSWRGFPARLAAIAGCLGVAALPFLTHDPEAYTNRGYVWIESLMAWRSSPVFGLGSRYYADVAVTSQALGPTVFHGHNQVVHLLVTGGIVALALVAALTLALIDVAVRWAVRGALFPIAFVAAIIGACTFEVSLALVDNTFMFPVVGVPMAFLLFSSRLDEGRRISAGRAATGDPRGATVPGALEQPARAEPARG